MAAHRPDRDRQLRDDEEWIYRRSFRHPKTGKIIRAKPGKCFRFKVKRQRQR